MKQQPTKINTVFLNKWFNFRGFVHKKRLFWYTHDNGLLRVVGFDNKTNNYEALYFIQPLFDFSDCFVLEYGDTLVRKYESNLFMLYKDMPVSYFERNVDNCLQCFETKIIPFLNQIATAEDLFEATINNEMFFSDVSNILRLQAYCKLYSKRYEEALMLFQKYIEYVKKHGYCYESILKEPLSLVELLKQIPEKAFEILQDNVSKSAMILSL